MKLSKTKAALPVDSPFMEIFKNRVLSLAGVSYFLGVLPALAQLISNGYWLQASVAAERQSYLPAGPWDGVFLTLAICLATELLFFGAFFYPVLKLGRTAVIGYLVANGIAALYSTLIFVAVAQPSSQAGWGLLGLAVVPLVPLALGIFLAVLAVRGRIERRRPKLVKVIRP